MSESASGSHVAGAEDMLVRLSPFLQSSSSCHLPGSHLPDADPIPRRAAEGFARPKERRIFHSSRQLGTHLRVCLEDHDAGGGGGARGATAFGAAAALSPVAVHGGRHRAREGSASGVAQVACRAATRAS
eukprot:scaffold7735_cov248-Pinguiococcus_pyrenoidosus.AAC.6